MKAIRLHAHQHQPVLDDVPKPGVAGPLDVVVEIGGHTTTSPLAAALDACGDLEAGDVRGRAILVPSVHPGGRHVRTQR